MPTQPDPNQLPAQPPEQAPEAVYADAVDPAAIEAAAGPLPDLGKKVPVKGRAKPKPKPKPKKKAKPKKPATERRNPIPLEGHLVGVATDWVLGKANEPIRIGAVEEDKLTVAVIVRHVQARAGTTISSGAVTAALNRLEKVGAVVLGLEPRRFIGFTDDARTLGIEKVKMNYRERARAAKAAAKAQEATKAEAEAEVQPETGTGVEPPSPAVEVATFAPPAASETV